MAIADMLDEIDRAKEESLSRAQRGDAQYESRRQAYRKGLRETQRIADTSLARELAEWIVDRIRTEKTLPGARDVRQKGAQLCRREGYEISTGSWLGA